MSTIAFAPELVLRPLATRVGGTLADDQVRVDGDVIYIGIDGRVRLQRYGYPVTTLGHETDEPDDLAARYLDTVTGVGP